MTHAVAVAAPAPTLVAGSRPLAIVPRTLEEASHLARAIVASGLAPTRPRHARGLPHRHPARARAGAHTAVPPSSASPSSTAGRRCGATAPWLWCAPAASANGCASISRARAPRPGAPPVRSSGAARAGPIERRFSVQDARRAGLWGRPGPWSQYPQRMLQMRARAFALRDAFADVLGGLYLREELEDADARRALEPAPRRCAHLRPPRPRPAAPSADRPVDRPATPEVPVAARPGRRRRSRRRDIARRECPAEPADPPVRCRASPMIPPQRTFCPLPARTWLRRRAASRLLPPRRPPPRDALRSRYAQGWSVRQPRTLAARRPSPLRAPPPPPWPTSGVTARTRTFWPVGPLLPAAAPSSTARSRRGRERVRSGHNVRFRPAGRRSSRPVPDPARMIPRRFSPITTMPWPAPATRRSSPRSTRSSRPSSTALSREHRARAHRTRHRHAARIAALAQPGRDGAAP